MTFRFCSVLAFVLFALTVGACASDDHPSSATAANKSAPLTDGDRDLCEAYCDGLAETCPAAFDELKGADCSEGCLSPDSDTAFRQCLADAASCDDLRTCKTTP